MLNAYHHNVTSNVTSGAKKNPLVPLPHLYRTPTLKTGSAEMSPLHTEIFSIISTKGDQLDGLPIW